MTERSERLAEVERLSRRPHAALHARLLDVVLTAMDSLTPEEWSTLAKRAPDRLVQALSMSGRLAGYSERSEVEVSGSSLVEFAMRIERLSDSEIQAELAKLRAAEPETPALPARTAEPPVPKYAEAKGVRRGLFSEPTGAQANFQVKRAASGEEKSEPNARQPRQHPHGNDHGAPSPRGA